MQASDRALADTARRMPDDGETQPAPDLRLQRILKLVVAALAILIFAGLTAVVWRVIYLASPSTTQPAATQPAAPTLAIRPDQSLELPPGAQVRSISLSGSQLAVHYEAGGATGIAILDLRTGRKVTDVAVEPNAQGNGAPAP